MRKRLVRNCYEQISQFCTEKFFSTKNGAPDPPQQAVIEDKVINIDNDETKHVKNTKFLAIITNYNPSWTDHMNVINTA